jgi:hypothetical protein
VRELAFISKNMARKAVDPYDGWDETDALVHWAKLFGPNAMDHDLFGFLANEVKLKLIETTEQMQDIKQWQTVKQWQADLIRLIEHMLRHGMPMQRLDPRPPYGEETRMARNSEEALLACMSACARTIGEVYDIDWPEKTSAGDWISRLRGQRKETEYFSCFPLSLLNHINLKGQFLVGQDLSFANLYKANLREANLRAADMTRANLYAANLHEANLHEAKLSYARLSSANLSYACLNEANMYEANLHGAMLENVNLGGVHGLKRD